MAGRISGVSTCIDNFFLSSRKEKSLELKEWGAGQQPSQLSHIKDPVLQAVQQRSCEGLVIKLLDAGSQYVAGKRSSSWVKLKKDYLEASGEVDEEGVVLSQGDRNPRHLPLPDSLDLVPVGAYWGQGRRAGKYGAFLMAAVARGGGREEGGSITDGCSTLALIPVCRVGTGLSDSLLDQLFVSLQPLDTSSTSVAAAASSAPDPVVL